MLYYRGVPYPRRVYFDRAKDPTFFLRTLNALGIVKKFLFSLTYLKGVVIPIRLDIRKYEPFLAHLYEQLKWILEDYYIKDKEFSVPVWEIGKFVRGFLEGLGLNEELSRNYARIVMMILEFDNAYRYRAQDILGEIEKLNNPRKEIKRLFKIYSKRELLERGNLEWGARAKIRKILLLRHLLLLPKIKRAFKAALKEIDLKKIKRSEEHTSELQSHSFISYAVFCLKKKK